MKKERCIIIPAIKKSAVIPDQLVKKMAGATLIQRSLDTAKQLVRGNDIYVVTDSEEISLICRRNAVNYHYEQSLRFNSADILRELKFFTEKQADHYHYLIIYRPSSPLVDHQDIKKGYDLILEKDADILVTLKKQEHRIWKEGNGHPDHLICNDEAEAFLVEVKSFLIIKSKIYNGHKGYYKIAPYYLDDKAIEICNYQDWWICEKLLKQKQILFVVTGHPAIGLGHVYRSLTLAHEITDHRIKFLCTKNSELAVKRIAERDYRTVLQTNALLDDVLKLKPDLVINDILETEEAYVKSLVDAGIKVVNFEDIGSGADDADLVVNALYSPNGKPPEKYLYGHQYFCLRDEFTGVVNSRFHKKAKNLLITFGGTDPCNFTLQTVRAVQDICGKNNIKIYLVTGPGYMHGEQLQDHLRNMSYQNIEYFHQTGIISAIMEKADLAISSAGRTVYELAHMRVPAIIMSQNEREHSHTFARPENGFEYIGVMENFNSQKLIESFHKLLDNNHRRRLHDRMKGFHFERNKKRVIKKILSLLDEE